MYESKYPDVDDVVMVQVKSIAEMGAYVSLLEYNGIEGMILLSELSRRRIRSITKLIKVCERPWISLQHICVLCAVQDRLAIQAQVGLHCVQPLNACTYVAAQSRTGTLQTLYSCS